MPFVRSPLKGAKLFANESVPSGCSPPRLLPLFRMRLALQASKDLDN
jgi:hypothetical protein